MVSSGENHSKYGTARVLRLSMRTTVNGKRSQCSMDLSSYEIHTCTIAKRYEHFYNLCLGVRQLFARKRCVLRSAHVSDERRHLVTKYTMHTGMAVHHFGHNWSTAAPCCTYVRAAKSRLQYSTCRTSQPATPNQNHISFMELHTSTVVGRSLADHRQESIRRTMYNEMSSKR